MNEPVSSPSILSITAPPAKPSRAVSDDFSKQLSSHAKADESRSSSSKKDVKTEESSTPQASSKKETSTETEPKATSTEETAATDPQDETTPSQSEITDDLPVSEETAEELVVAVPIIVAPASEELSIPEELLSLEESDEIVAVTDETPEEPTHQTAELLDLETDSESAEGKSVTQAQEKPTAEGIDLEADDPDTVVASAEITAKKSGKQEPSTSNVIEGNEVGEDASIATEATTNDQNSGGEQKEKKASAEPSLLSELNNAAIQGDGKEQNEAEPAVQKPTPTPAPLPATAVAAVEKALPADEGNLDNNDSTGRNASINGVEERANQRAELAAAAKTRTNSAPTVDPSRFVSRVAKAFDAAQQQGGPIRIRLSPPELGMLQIQIEVREGVLTASLEAETHAARNLLLENLPGLRDRLAEQQISIEKFDVDVRDESSNSGYEQSNSQQADSDTQGDRQNQRNSSTTDASNVKQVNETPTTTHSTISFDNDRVDLVA